MFCDQVTELVTCLDRSPTPRQHRLNSTASSISEEFSVLEYEMGGEVVGETAGPDEVGSRMRLDSFYSAKSRSSAFYSVASSSYQSITSPEEQGDKDQACMYGPPSRLPTLSQPVPAHWTTIEGTVAATLLTSKRDESKVHGMTKGNNILHGLKG